MRAKISTASDRYRTDQSSSHSERRSTGRTDQSSPSTPRRRNSRYPSTSGIASPANSSLLSAISDVDSREILRTLPGISHHRSTGHPSHLSSSPQLHLTDYDASARKASSHCARTRLIISPGPSSDHCYTQIEINQAPDCQCHPTVTPIAARGPPHNVRDQHVRTSLPRTHPTSSPEIYHPRHESRGSYHRHSHTNPSSSPQISPPPITVDPPRRPSSSPHPHLNLISTPPHPHLPSSPSQTWVSTA